MGGPEGPLDSPEHPEAAWGTRAGLWEPFWYEVAARDVALAHAV